MNEAQNVPFLPFRVPSLDLLRGLNGRLAGSETAIVAYICEELLSFNAAVIFQRILKLQRREHLGDTNNLSIAARLTGGFCRLHCQDCLHFALLGKESQPGKRDLVRGKIT